MVRKATKKDISRIAEIIVFGKRVAYRSIFQNDEVSFNEMQVIPLWKEYNDNPEKKEHVIAESKESGKSRIFLWVLEENISARRFYEANGFHASGETCLVEGTDKVDMCYELIVGTAPPLRKRSEVK